LFKTHFQATKIQGKKKKIRISMISGFQIVPLQIVSKMRVM
jgi:hypothetical protein